MQISLSWRAAGCVALAWLLVPSIALADAHVTALDGRAWAEVITALESDVASQGTSVSLCVRDEAHPACLPCGSYALELDAIGAQALRLDACDPTSGATTMTLVDRGALFDHTHPITRPRAVTVRAIIVSATETSGGAAATGGSALGCLAHVRPYLRDLELGTNVYLSPADYDVHVTQAGIDVSSFGDGWMLVSATRIDAEVSYEVHERASGELVMTGHASLECASETLTTIDAPAAAVTAAASGTYDGGDAAHVAPGFRSLAPRSGRAGGPVTGADLSALTSCVGHYPVAAQHVLQIDAHLDALRIRVDGAPDDLTLAIRTSDGQWICDDDGNVEPHRQDPIVVLRAPPTGRVEIWVGTFAVSPDRPYRIGVFEDGATPEYASRTARRRASDARSLVIAGALTSAFSWVFLTSFEALPMLVTTGDDIPPDTWRELAWIPFVGPWIAQAVDGSATSSFQEDAMIDAALQDIGFVSLLASFAIHESRPATLALGDAPDAPRLALGGGRGSMVGVTLTF